MLYKQLTAKRWAKLQGENLWKVKFVLMASLGLLFKSGQLSAEEVVEKMMEGGITEQDRRIPSGDGTEMKALFIPKGDSYSIELLAETPTSAKHCAKHSSNTGTTNQCR